MPSFSKRSLSNLETCDERLQAVAYEAVQDFDFAVICGHRSKEEQDKAIADGKSKTPWPTSKHNSIPSGAMDLVPFPVDWNNTARFKTMAAIVLDAAEKLGIELRWGADWDRDGSIEDEKFIDFPHFELVEKGTG